MFVSANEGMLSVIYAKCFKCRTPSCIGLLIDQLTFRPVDSGLLYYVLNYIHELYWHSPNKPTTCPPIHLSTRSIRVWPDSLLTLGIHVPDLTFLYSLSDLCTQNIFYPYCSATVSLGIYSQKGLLSWALRPRSSSFKHQHTASNKLP